MNKPVRLGGKTFTPELLTHLNDLRAAQPRPGKIAQARTICTVERQLDFPSPTTIIPWSGEGRWRAGRAV